MVRVPSWALLRSSRVLKRDAGCKRKMGTRVFGRHPFCFPPSFHVHKNCQLVPKCYSKEERGATTRRTTEKPSRRVLVTGSRSHRRLVMKVSSSEHPSPAWQFLKKVDHSSHHPTYLEGARPRKPALEFTSSPALDPFPWFSNFSH